MPVPAHAVSESDSYVCYQLLTSALFVLPAARYAMCNTHIPNLYSELRADKQQLINWDGDGIIGAMSSDGWKKKAAAQGTPLINLSLLLPDGGSIFWEVVPARGVVKNAEWIRNLHIEMANKITNNKPNR